MSDQSSRARQKECENQVYWHPLPMGVGRQFECLRAIGDLLLEDLELFPPRVTGTPVIELLPPLVQLRLTCFQSFGPLVMVRVECSILLFKRLG